VCLNRALWLSLVVIGAYSSSQCVVQEFESFWWQFIPSDTQWCAKFGRWENSNDAILEHSGTFSQVSRQHPQDRSQNCNGQCPDMSPTYPNFCGNFEQTLFDTAGNSLPKHIQKASFFLILHNGIISLGSEKFTGDISYDYIYIQCLKLISVDLSSGRPLSEGVMVSEGVPVHCKFPSFSGPGFNWFLLGFLGCSGWETHRNYFPHQWILGYMMINYDTCDRLWPTTIFAIIVKCYGLDHNAIKSHVTDLKMMWFRSEVEGCCNDPEYSNYLMLKYLRMSHIVNCYLEWDNHHNLMSTLSAFCWTLNNTTIR